MTTQPAQPEPVSTAPEEETQFLKQAEIKTQKEQERQKQQQEQEETEFRKQLEEKNLKELMELQKQLEKDAENKTAAIDAVNRGDLSALTPYIKHSEHDRVRINHEDAEKGMAIIAEKHLRNEKFVSSIKEGQNTDDALDYSNRRLKELFPTLNTEVALVKDDKGKPYIATMGVSMDEVQAAEELRHQQRVATKQSAEVAAHIQDKIKEGPQKTAADSVDDETIKTPVTPSVQRENAAHGRTA
jgi:hypothetical protein